MSNIKKGPNEKTCEAFIKELRELLTKYDAVILAVYKDDEDCDIAFSEECSIILSASGTYGSMIISNAGNYIGPKSYLPVDLNLDIDFHKEFLPAKREPNGNVSRDENGKVIFPGQIIKYTGTVSDIDRRYSEIVFEMFPTNHEIKGTYSSSYNSWSATCFGKQICDPQDSVDDAAIVCEKYLKEHWKEISKKLTVKTERK